MITRTPVRPALILMLLTVAFSVAAQDHVADAPPAPLEPEVAPELVTFVEAEYPPTALREGREGTVVLELLVTEAGLVDSVTVRDGLASDLDQAAVAAARGFVFTPARAEGVPVPVYVQFAYMFSVREQARRIERLVNLRGRLREMGTREPVAGAMVVAAMTAPDTTRLAVPLEAYLARLGQFEGQFLEEGNLVAFTDQEGWYEFQSLPAGELELRFPNAGFEALVEPLTLQPDEVLTVESWIRRTEYNEYEMVVYGRAEEREVTRKSLSVTEIERLPGFGGDVIKSLQALPGVARPTMSDPGAVVIRGSGNDDTRYFLDGIDIPLLFHFGGVKSTYNSLALQSVDMYPGGFGTSYGNAVGGIVELKGKPGRQDRWKVVADASLLDATLHAEGPLARDLTLTVSARRSFIGEVMGRGRQGQRRLRPGHRALLRRRRAPPGLSPGQRPPLLLHGLRGEGPHVPGGGRREGGQPRGERGHRRGRARFPLLAPHLRLRCGPHAVAEEHLPRRLRPPERKRPFPGLLRLRGQGPPVAAAGRAQLGGAALGHRACGQRAHPHALRLPRQGPGLGGVAAAADLRPAGRLGQRRPLPPAGAQGHPGRALRRLRPHRRRRPEPARVGPLRVRRRPHRHRLVGSVQPASPARRPEHRPGVRQSGPAVDPGDPRHRRPRVAVRRPHVAQGGGLLQHPGRHPGPHRQPGPELRARRRRPHVRPGVHAAP